MTLTVIGPISTGNPEYHVVQDKAAISTQRLTGFSRSLASRIPAIYKLSGIDRRHTCIKEYASDTEQHTSDPQTWRLSPYSTTRVRNAAYKESSIPLALRVASDALKQDGTSPDEVTHVVVTSCTGFFAPGLDIEISQRLGIRADVQRTLIGFMGCYAAFNALRLAHAFCQANPSSVVLIVCLELCSLHFQVEDNIESVAIQSLFADGCASVVVKAMDEISSKPDEPRRLVYERGQTLLGFGSGDMMTWDIGDHGFMMGLSSKVPHVLGEVAPGYVSDLLAPLHKTKNDIDHWAIHPGGKRIVESVQESLGLVDTKVADALAILRDYGNMSSPTILFVLKRMLQDNPTLSDDPAHTGDHIVAMGFGPGLTVEGCVLKVV